jgi:hypothetical protein
VPKEIIEQPLTRRLGAPTTELLVKTRKTLDCIGITGIDLTDPEMRNETGESVRRADEPLPQGARRQHGQDKGPLLFRRGAWYRHPPRYSPVRFSAELAGLRKQPAPYAHGHPDHPRAIRDK